MIVFVLRAKMTTAVAAATATVAAAVTAVEGLFESSYSEVILEGEIFLSENLYSPAGVAE